MRAMALREMPAEWSETNHAEGQIVIAFEGIDQDAQDALDVENFSRGVHAPEREDPGGQAFVHTRRAKMRVLTPRGMVSQTLGILFAGVTWGTLAELGVRNELIVLFVFLAGMLGLGLLDIIGLFRAVKAAPVKRSTQDRFTLSLDPHRFTLAGERLVESSFELRSVASFVGDRRLSIALTDGRTVRLPCRLRSTMHVALAGRLNQLLHEARARAGGYRGAQ